MKEKNSEKELFRKAEKIIKKSKTIYWLARLFFEKDTKRFFYLWYSYLRWVDDIVDSMNTKYSKERKYIFLERQESIVQKIYDGIVTKNEVKNGELFLIPLISFDKSRNNKLRETIFGILAHLVNDIERRGEIQSEETLDYHLKIEAKSCIKIINYFCNSDDFLIGYQGGIGSEWSHILRDFCSDIDADIINISKEDMEKFGIANSLKAEINSPNFRKWVKHKISFAKSQFTIAKHDFYKYQHSLRHKIAFEVLCAKYEFYIDRIVKDDYYLRKDYTKIPDTAIFLFWILKAVFATFLTHILKRS
jgi:phytoene/squalene synthetase